MTGMDQALIEAVPCKMDPEHVVEITNGKDRGKLHMSAAQFAEFTARVKRGDFDHLGIGPAS